MEAADVERFDSRLKDLERRVHTLEDRHEDIVRATHGLDESMLTLEGNPPSPESASDRERKAEERAAAEPKPSIFEDLGMTKPKSDKPPAKK